MALSFIGVTFAAVQVVDRLDVSRRDAAIAAIEADWAWALPGILSLGELIDNPEVVKLYGADERLEESHARQIRTVIRVLQRSLPTIQQDETAFSIMREFCLTGVGMYQFALDRPLYYYSMTFGGQEQLPPAQEFSAGSVTACARSFNISSTAREVLRLDKEHALLRPITMVSVFWYVPLALGFALKCAKNSSDLRRANRS